MGWLRALARFLAAALVAVAPLACAGSATSERTDAARLRAPTDGETSGDDELAHAYADLIRGTAASQATGGMPLQQQMTASAEPEGEGAEAAPAPAPPPPPRDVARPASPREDAPSTPAAPTTAQVTTTPDDRKLSLIYDARIHLAVFETEHAIEAAEQLARTVGGYLVYRDDRGISFRVPAAQFQGALDAAVKLGDVLHREVRVQDVTEEFRDLGVRLRNAEAVRDRLEQLLARANGVTDALHVEKELERLAAEIERIKGRLTVLRELVAFSTITLQFQPRPVDQVDSHVRLPFPWLNDLGLSRLLDL